MKARSSKDFFMTPPQTQLCNAIPLAWPSDQCDDASLWLGIDNPWE